MKKCSKCQREKDESEFGFHKQIKSGLQPACKSCVAIQTRIYRDSHKKENKEYQKIWSINNPDKIAEKIKKANARKKETGYREKYNLEHKEKIKEVSAKWYVEHKEHAVKKNKEYAISHKEQALERSRRYRARNPEKVAAANLKRREARVAVRNLAKSDCLINLLELQNYKCANKLCGCDLRKNKKHIDHKNPVHLGGSGEIQNLQWLCAKCNLSKAHMPYDKWIARIENEIDVRSG